MYQMLLGLGHESGMSSSRTACVMCRRGADGLALGLPWMCQLEGELPQNPRLSSSLTDIHCGSQINILVHKLNKPRITELWLAACSFLATPGSSTHLGEVPVNFKDLQTQ
jgi:hypothetical protein